jgi:hypothetical protein
MAVIRATGRAGAASTDVADVARPRPLDLLVPASTAGTGSLPHRDASDAAHFALTAYDLPTAPSLPRRSPAESRVAQALVGVAGVTLGPYGTVAIDPLSLDPDAPIETDIDRDHFVGFRTFLDLAAERGHVGPIMWHFAGPMGVARSAVRAHVKALAAEVIERLPAAAQIAVLDEPGADRITSRELPITPDEAIDLLSAAMAAIEPVAAVGVHSCADLDVTLLLEAGPHLVSLPVSQSIVPLAGYLDRFLARGGWIAWGAVATEGPIGVTANRSWHQLAEVWGGLVDRGCDLDRLRQQCIITPQCGLGAHGVGTVERIGRTLHDIARAARSDAARAQLLLRG